MKERTRLRLLGLLIFFFPWTWSRPRRDYGWLSSAMQTGLSRQIEVLDAQVALTTARANYLQAVFDYQAASARLDRAMGKEV